MRIVFMGSPEFAVPVLHRLLESKHNIIAVYTKPPGPAGRGRVMTPTPIHQFSLSNHLPILTPKSLKTETPVPADIAVVVAYGLILPPHFLQAYKYGCINLHPSLLPKWRGAAPIQRAAMSSHDITGITFMLMNDGLDTGDIIKQYSLKISNEDDAQTLHDKLAAMGSHNIAGLLKDIEQGSATYTPQNELEATYADKITSNDEIINWELDAEVIFRQIRSLSPKPCASFKIGNKNIKIIKADYLTQQHNMPNGMIIDDKMNITCNNGIITPIVIRPAGKKSMSIRQFLNGTIISTPYRIQG